jgi:hypothetical protein
MEYHSDLGLLIAGASERNDILPTFAFFMEIDVDFNVI